MRILVVIAHYFKHRSSTDNVGSLGSGRAPIAKLAALNAQIVSLHKYFGPHRASLNPADRFTHTAQLDIVILTKEGANLLDFIGLSPPTYSVEYVDVDPIMMGFEAQRVMAEREGQYDIFAYMEDDLIVDDPAFFEKIRWFADTFGPKNLLLPTHYEMGWTGTPAKVAVATRLSQDQVAPFRQGHRARLSGGWGGTTRHFVLPNNPHARCFVITPEQLRHWVQQPSFYDRDVSWIDPLVSAATFAPGKVFGIYKPAENDPWFLQIEHYGTRYATTVAREGERFGEPPLLAMAEQLSRHHPEQIAVPGISAETVNMLVAEASQIKWRLEKLERSRSALLKALFRAMWAKTRR